MGTIEEKVAVPQTQLQSVYSERTLLLEMLTILIDEFNCNHQADLEDAEGRVEIYSREKE
jgi:hypothetical protein